MSFWTELHQLDGTPAGGDPPDALGGVLGATGDGAATAPEKAMMRMLQQEEQPGAYDPMG